MKRFFLGIGFLVVILFLILIFTKRLDLEQALRPVKNSFQKVLKSIESPVGIKEATERKIKEIEQRLKEKAEKLFKKTGD